MFLVHFNFEGYCSGGVHFQLGNDRMQDPHTKKLAPADKTAKQMCKCAHAHVHKTANVHMDKQKTIVLLFIYKRNAANAKNVSHVHCADCLFNYERKRLVHEHSFGMPHPGRPRPASHRLPPHGCSCHHHSCRAAACPGACCHDAAD